MQDPMSLPGSSSALTTSLPRFKMMDVTSPCHFFAHSDVYTETKSMLGFAVNPNFLWFVAGPTNTRERETCYTRDLGLLVKLGQNQTFSQNVMNLSSRSARSSKLTRVKTVCETSARQGSE